MADRDGRPGATATRDRNEGKKRGILPWLLALLVLAALAVGAFFLLGGDVDSDTEGEFDVDVQVPESDIDVDGPDIDAEAPDVDVDPGSVDVDEGDAEADASSN